MGKLVRFDDELNDAPKLPSSAVVIEQLQRYILVRNEEVPEHSKNEVAGFFEVAIRRAIRFPPSS